MVSYADDSSVRDARAQYFAANGFSDATYVDDWVRLELGPLSVCFPNTPSRKRAIPMHDLHHVATGYPATFTGEAEIGAWEVAGGCTTYWAAWVLNGMAFASGLLIAPRRTYRAFVSGRHARPLYHEGWDETLLDLSVGQLRERLAVRPTPAKATWRDRAAFAGWVSLVAVPPLAVIALGVAWLAS